MLFIQTVDTIDHLLNDAIDFHAQAVDHRRNSATVAGFWNRSVLESEHFC
jgi:hypothetical protein